MSREFSELDKQDVAIQFVLSSRQSQEIQMKKSFARMTDLIPSTVRQTVVVLTYAIVLATAVSMLSNSASAQSCTPVSTAPGSLDTCFGSGGKVTSSLGGTTGSWAVDVALQTDGRIVVLTNGFQVLRYRADGLIDSTFGAGGVATISFIKSGGQTGAYALAIQPDDKIIVAGYATFSGNAVGFAVGRFNSNGSIDTSFGSAGKVLFNFQKNVSAVARGVTIQSNSYIVVAGDSDTVFALARLTPTGAFDPGFNGTGKVTVSTSSFTTATGGAYDVAIQRITVGGIVQEKVVAAGIRPSDYFGNRDIAVLRFNPNGSLDTSFGTGGKVFTDFSGYSDQAKAVVIDANNNIVVAGHMHVDSTLDSIRFALVRYTENGQLDTSFGSAGKVTAGVIGYRSFFDGHCLAIQSDGRIVASGKVEMGSTNNGDFAVARFNTDGTLDASFGSATTGIVLTDFYGERDQSSGLALQGDGRIVVAGGANPSPMQIALARYMP